MLDAFPGRQWLPISQLYETMRSDSVKEHVRPRKTLAAVLRDHAEELGITVHENNVYWRKGSQQEVEDNVEEGESTPVAAAAPFHNPFTPSTVSAMENEDAQPVDFFYDVRLTVFPPPPKDFMVTPSSLGGARPNDDGSVISLKSFVSYIPPFFVPVEELLEAMPGYTMQHIESYFKSSVVELVTIEGQRYMRLYGGHGKFSLEGCEAAEELFARYKPNLHLVQTFVNAFEGVKNKWMPLSVLLERADSEVVEKLPFKGAAAIIYFAQMQHIFAFAVDAKNGGAVLLRPEEYGGLECNTTPTPRSINFLLRSMPHEGTCDLAHLETSLAPELQREVKEYYGSLARCLEMHKPLFFLDKEHDMVMLTRYRQRLHVASLSLEEQLNIASQRRDKSKIRSLRRRIAFRDNPSHSFHDPENLAREMSKHLPRKGFVLLKQFMKKNISEEMLFFMPKKSLNFFANYPQYFTQFEFQQAGCWCLCRPEEPLPKGVIRQKFSEGDTVRLVAQYLQQKGPKSCTQILINLPRGAQETIKKKHGGLFYMVSKYSQYFNVIISSETTNAASSSIVHLTNLPGNEMMDHDDTGTDASE